MFSGQATVERCRERPPSAACPAARTPSRALSIRGAEAAPALGDGSGLQALQRIRFLCVECGALASEVDHVLPRERGGRDVLENLRSLCSRCHAERHGRTRYGPREQVGAAHVLSDGAYNEKTTRKTTARRNVRPSIWMP